ncbi:unnamed protein product [Mytilus coruscus]|uniref:Uncharacterized protein n=1 Tax=Mytilus coruscus TaxID=42192 RepID=A0A6J8ANS9_MYTCO|nr:unnamed protein product [Mytilus coruscus]
MNTDISGYYKILTSIECSLKSEKSSFIIGACEYHYAKISQYVAQLLSPPTANGLTRNINEHHHRHLQNGINADAASGQLLYASFYYVTGQYKLALELVDYVLSTCKPDIVELGKTNFDEADINNYIKRVHNLVHFHTKINKVTIGSVTYMRQSPLVPLELQFLVKNRIMTIHPIVFVKVS